MKNPSEKRGRKREAPGEEKGAKMEARNGPKGPAGSPGAAAGGRKGRKRGGRKGGRKKEDFWFNPVLGADGPAECAWAKKGLIRLINLIYN